MRCSICGAFPPVAEKLTGKASHIRILYCKECYLEYGGDPKYLSEIEKVHDMHILDLSISLELIRKYFDGDFVDE